MNIDRLQDRISFGMGAAARKSGSDYAVYRPCGFDQPISQQNRIIDLPVAFQPFGRVTSGGRDAVVWEATLDCHYTEEGDYLAGAQGTFFIAMQRPALPVRCVLANCRVSVIRPSFAAQGSYNGLSATGGVVIVNGWPAYMDAGEITITSGSETIVNGRRSILLPKLPASIRIADLIIDEVGTNYVVGSAEQNAMGLRVMTRTSTP